LLVQVEVNLLGMKLGQQWEFPPLAEARRRWEAKWGRHNWDEPLTEWLPSGMDEVLQTRSADIEGPEE